MVKEFLFIFLLEFLKEVVHILFYLFLIFIYRLFIYLAASGLSCSTQDLCSIMQGLLLWFRLLCVVLRLQSTRAQ